MQPSVTTTQFLTLPWCPGASFFESGCSACDLVGTRNPWLEALDVPDDRVGRDVGFSKLLWQEEAGEVRLGPCLPVRP